MPLYVRDYLADTAHLRASESGAYLHLIMAYWVNGKLQDDDRQLATIAKMTMSEWKRARPVLEPFFGPGFGSHKRIDKELERTAEVSASYAARASQAAKTRWSKRTSKDASSIPEAMLETCHGMPSSQPHTQKKDTEAIASVRDRPKRALEIPEQPTEKAINFAVSHSWAPPKIQSEWERFRDHSLAKGKKHRDFEAAWRNWVTSPYQQTGTSNGAGNNGVHRKSSGADFFAGIAEVAKDLDRDGDLAEHASETIPRGRVEFDA